MLVPKSNGAGLLVPSVLLLILGMQALPACAGEIQGQVLDALGHAIVDSGITLKKPDGSIVGQTKSDAEGRFSFSEIAQGSYAIQAEKNAFKPSLAIVSVTSDGKSGTQLTLAANDTLEIKLNEEKISQARNSLSPKTGGSLYTFDANDIANLPQGDSTALNQVLLQAPGVVNDSYGQLHVRGDHANTQYRIDGVILPEGISGFGQALDTRFAESIDLITGALPAQYGYRTAGVVEITTKDAFDGVANVGVITGSNHTVNPSFEYGNTDGRLSYFVSGSFLKNNVGIENPTSSTNPIHDTTDQNKGFAMMSYLLDPTTKLTMMFGSYNGHFQIPNNPGQQSDPNNIGILGQLNLSTYDSSTLNDQQSEVNRFFITTLQGSLSSELDYQLAFFSRYSSFNYQPDITGNLVFNGVASDIYRSSYSNGIQTDASYHLNSNHTLRTGLFMSSENIVSDDTSTVFPVDANGNVSGPAYNVVDNNKKNGNTLFGLYLQDEWKASNKLTINYGIRYDTVNAYVNEQQFSPRLGLVYKSSEQTSWHAGYSRYFTPPPTELVSSSTLSLFNGTTNAASGQNSSIKSERGNYLDAGFTHDISPTLSVGLDTYYERTTNTIDEGQFGPALLLTPFNYAEGKIYGAELTANYKQGDFSAYANLARNVSKAKDIVSSQYLFDQATLNYAANNWVNVDHEQALTISAGASYQIANYRLNGDLIFESGLRNGFANTTSLSSYTVVNLAASRNIMMPYLGKIDMRVMVNNLLDRIYEVRDGSGIGVFAPQYGARRELLVGLDKNF